jgi:hypothetical protein
MNYYNDNITITYIKKMLEDEDTFFTFISASDYPSIMAFYDHCLSLFNDH